MRGMEEGRMREQGLNSVVVSVVGDDPTNKVATEVTMLTTDSSRAPLGSPAGGLLDFDSDCDLDELDELPLPVFTWLPNDDWGDLLPLRFRFHSPDILTLH
eukprot:3479831-Rhodomonas_salina.3